MLKTKTFTPSNENTTYFLSNATGATWTLTNTSTPDSIAHQVSIKNDSATDHSDKTALLTGTDENGVAQTETVTLPTGSATVESTKYFKTLTSIVPSATIGADTMDIGYVDEISTNWFQLDHAKKRKTVAFNIIIAGTINYTVQQTLQNIQTTGRDSVNWLNHDDTSLVSATTSQNGNYDFTPSAMRIIINSYSSGATLQVSIIQGV